MDGRGGTAAADGRAESGGAGGLFRPDVEGLRGVAILLVLLFHGALPVPGGFVGVDVFLVISGYLITGLLLRELETSGRIDLPAFYGRRLRRLLPAAAVTIAVVLPLAYVALPPLDRSGAMADGAAAVLCASNIRSALAAGDYFTAVASPSPFLHFWSLSLEEQFYLAWPLLLLLVARGGRTRLAAGTALVVLGCASLVASVVLTDAAATWGYYSLPSRAWQFAAGGLIAASAVPLQRLPSRPVAAAGWLGVAAIVAAALTIDGTIPYPGLVALLPTVAAAVLIVAGDRPGGPGRLLRVAPLRFLGRISYSLYLWHWPLLVLPVAATGVELDVPQTAGLLALAVVVAWGSWAFVEEPFRKAHGARRTVTRLSLQLGTATIVGVVAWSAMLGVSADAAIAGISTGPRADVSARDDDGPASLGGVASVTPSPAGGAGESAPSDEGTTARADLTADPGGPRSPIASASDTIATGSPGARSNASSAPSSREPAIAWSSIPDRRLPGGVRLPADVLPALGDARRDRERLADDGCFTWLEGTKPAECVYGDKHGAVTIVLIGDSHAGHWFPAFNVLARRHGWRLIPLVKASCPFVDMAVLHPFAKREYTECATWRQRAIRAANAARPDLVVVASAYRGIRATTPAQDGAKPEGQAMARAIGRLSAPVAVIVDNPRTGTDIPACLSRHAADVNACAIPRWEALGPSFGTRERIAAQLSGAALVDVIAEVCPSMPCPVVRDGMILYRDGHHLTATFVRSLAPAFDAAIQRLLAGPASPASPTAVPSAAVPTAAPSGAAPASVTGAAAASVAPAASTMRPAAAAVDARFDILSGAGAKATGGALEPVVATHPTDPDVLAVAYERRRSVPACSGASLEAAIAVSLDGGRTWHAPRGRPWDGSGRVSSYHSAVAWGPGPKPGAARLYWAGTTTRRCGGDLRVALAWSDDAGATWSPLHVFVATPAWVGGMPDITVDRNPLSHRYGTVWVAYNFPAASGLGSGVRVVASTDFGRSWHGVSVPRAPAPVGFPASWRFGYRIATAPDGAAYVSWYQADLRRWDPARVFERGPLDNVGRIGFAIARLTADGRTVRAARPVLAATVSRNPWTLGDRSAPGTRAHTYVDPMWSHGLAVDASDGTVYLAIGDYVAPGAPGPAGTVRVGRSDDRAQTWAWTTVPAPAPVGGTSQSAFRPGVVARDGTVIVGLRTIDDVAGREARRADAIIRAAWAVSRDAGRTFSVPRVISGSGWRASVLAGALNGPGTRDRLDLTADGRVAFAYGIGRNATTSATGRVGTVQVAIIRAAPQATEQGTVARRASFATQLRPC